jgi:hypothetical protein
VKQLFFGGALAALLCLPVAGCNTAETPSGRPMANDDVPRSWERAHILEEKSITAQERAEQAKSEKRRRELYDDAIASLKEARDLYVAELEAGGMPPERERNARAEFDRLGRVIEACYKKRPS